MNILLIGNGFDLAHGLPTTYGDFLLFAKMIKRVVEEIGIKKLIPKNDKEFKNWTDNIQTLKSYNLDSIFFNLISDEVSNKENQKFKGIKDYVINLFTQGDMTIRKNLVYYINDNFWIEYFIQCDMYQKENWIDFENEISNIVQSFDKDIHNSLNEIKISDEAVRNKISKEFLRDYFIVDTDQLIQSQEMIACEEARKKELNVHECSNYINKYKEEHSIDNFTSISYKTIIEQLENDLNRLILALEIYIADYIDNINVICKSPDIEFILEKFRKTEQNLYARENKFISFNYSHTCKRLYDIPIKDNYDFIHGEAKQIKNKEKFKNNMVLGIDEYLSKRIKNKYTEFIGFKKYYQRIYKESGSHYKDWIDEIKRTNKAIKEQIKIKKDELKKNKGLGNEGFNTKKVLERLEKNPPKHFLYIFGHSLDVTDGDILRDLILNDNVYTNIYYFNEEVHARQIVNLVKVIGQDELIRRTGGSTRTIKFIPQQEI